MAFETPFEITAIGILVFLATYFLYTRAVDRRVWSPDPKKPTPAHMYMDGVEFFPVSRFVLYGFQWNSIAALGPILGPGIALTFGWLPAFLWIVFASIFIGWVQDYSAMFKSLRHGMKHNYAILLNGRKIYEGEPDIEKAEASLAEAVRRILKA
jgi:carbon starvation protein